MKYKFDIKEVTKEQALVMVQTYHYSDSLPRLNRHFLGIYLEEELVGLVTLGWGTRPLHTIRRLFPSLETKDYFEIGRMCMNEDMPRNSESQMLSQIVKWIRCNLPEVKVLFTWADGMLGKPGYVYQASNFLYAGYSDTDTYLMNGVKVHPRQTKALFGKGAEDKRKSVRPTLQQMKEYDVQQYKGKQFRYVYFTCDKKTAKKLMNECTVPLNRDYPKHDDLKWRMKNYSGNWVESGIPPYKTDKQQKGESANEDMR